jgi:ribosomal protein S18 acetylase RimI-like enzyme
MTGLEPFRPTHLPALVELWNRTFVGGPNFVPIAEADFVRRVVSTVQFDTTALLVAMRGEHALGFVHFGPRLDLNETISEGQGSRLEWQIFALVAPRSEAALMRALLGAALSRCVAANASRVLLYPSWVFGTQSMYNGIAGAYEYPGLAADRAELSEVAAEAGFSQIAEYGTPELPVSDAGPLAAHPSEVAHLSDRAREWGLVEQMRVLEPGFFPGRRAVLLVHRKRAIAMTAYGPWVEYSRQYGRRVYGITSVQVDAEWRGRGLGKLVMLLAMEAARQAGAEALHLHVYRGNAAAWGLYHRALGFRPAHVWLTLAKELPGRHPAG